MRHFLLVLLISSAVSDMTVVVKRGGNVTLSVKTPEMVDVNRVTLLTLYENGTQVPIFRYCSIKEKKRGCPAIGNDRFSLQLRRENASVIILDACAADSGAHIVEVIGNYTIKETFNVVFTESSGDPSFKISPPQDFNTVVIIGVFAVLIIVVTVVSVYFYKKKNWKKFDFLDCTVDSEVADSRSSITGADECDTDASSEEHCLVEKEPEELDSTHPDNILNVR
ncbi:uncharacterized protein [Sinocyclocheilus grahami]|uniref:uncharacterized protein n=1 Tax=Sinocyclocheilus grahami TaxID=75366 RepID=UPI0007AD00C3|nr:PREDICTED: uncharacterized protein LOC107569434 [Sinocyclocheilus grahami]